ncbi:MAG: hypothetical protein AAF333_06000 [Planctomycetota bacterium]
MTRSTTRPANEFAAPRSGSPAEASVAAERVRWRTVFVDGAVLEATTPSPGLGDDQPVEQPDLRIVARREDEVAGVRKNVQDSARAVLAWLAAVVEHEGKTDLDDVLDRCLRPGPDVERVNYAAMAQDIFRVTGVELTAKRVQTAVSHLRASHARKHTEAGRKQVPASDTLRRHLDELDAKVRENFATLAADETAGHAAVRRAIGTEVLTAVRSAAGRVIDRDFGEGIPDTVNLEALEGRFLGFVRDTLRRQTFGSRAPGLEHDLRHLLITLTDHDATAESDMKLVMHGSAVVSSLLGVDSLPGVMAQLNVLVSGRGLIDTDLYVAEMIRLANLAESLHDDAGTRTYLNWNRRLPEDRRLPSAIRVASYCRANAATRMFDRLFVGDLKAHDTALADAGKPPRNYLQFACDTHDAMLQRDSGFTLTLTTEMIRHVTVAHLTGDQAPARDYVQHLGADKALDRLEGLIRYDNSDRLVAAARELVTSVFPELRRQLVCVR